VDAKSEAIVTSGYETQLSWWDARTAERIKRVGGPGAASHELAIDSKGIVCAVAGGDGSLRFYKPGGELTKAAQAGGSLFAVALDSGGTRAASGGADGTVKLWNVAEARLLLTLWSGPSDSWLALAPEGYIGGAESTLATAGWMASGRPVTEAKMLAPLRNTAPLARAARGERIAAPVWK